MNFLILLNMVLPYKTALDIESKLSSNIIISLASLETSVPEPIEKPTSAFFNAGASFTPSPVIPTTNPFFWASFTNLLLSCGKERAIIFKLGKISIISLSVILFNSLLSIVISFLLFISPTSFPIAFAVSRLSPVIIMVSIPAFLINSNPFIASGLTSSFIHTSPISVNFLFSFSFA